jgi:hypothetical protein
MATNQPNPDAGAKATAQAKAALDEFRRRAAAREGSVFGHPGITLGPPFGAQFGPGASPFPFPGQPGLQGTPGLGQVQPAANALFESLATMVRLGVDVLNSGLQGFLGASGARFGGEHSGDGHCGCGCESCCDQFAPPHGGGCGCGCMPGVHNCP